MSERIGPHTPDARPDTYWDGRGLAKGSRDYQRVSPATPAGLVGEYLPPLEDDEAEIVVIGTRTAMGDVQSIRARRDGDTIRYTMVDEYEAPEDGDATYTFEPQESSYPLTFKEVTNLLWSIRFPEWGQLFKQTWVQQSESDLKDYENDFFELDSEFYAGLQEWLDERFEDWKRQQVRKETG